MKSFHMIGGHLFEVPSNKKNRMIVHIKYTIIYFSAKWPLSSSGDQGFCSNVLLLVFHQEVFLSPEECLDLQRTVFYLKDSSIFHLPYAGGKYWENKSPAMFSANHQTVSQVSLESKVKKRKRICYSHY